MASADNAAAGNFALEVERSNPVMEAPAVQRTEDKPPKPDLEAPEKRAADGHTAEKTGCFSSFKAFIKGPYYPMVPEPEKRGQEQEDIDYLAELEEKARRAMDEDDEYGVQPHELVKLPFKAPAIYKTVIKLANGVISVAQKLLVLFVAILIEEHARAVRWGANSAAWNLILEIILMLYPCVTMLCLTIYMFEFKFREMMYYRLFTMRILVDWENIKLYKNWFFYYFFATWVLINVWALYGIGASWYTYTESGGSSSGSWAVWGIINLTSLSLMSQYYKVHSWEKRLVSVNRFVERDPILSARMLETMYIVPESALKAECYTFLWAINTAFWLRIGNILTCGCTCKEWKDRARDAEFDVDLLANAALNREDVERELGIKTVDLLSKGAQKRVAWLGKQREAMAEEGDKAHIQEGGVHPTDARAARKAVRGESYGLLDLILDQLYWPLYATIQVLLIAFMPGARSWPYRRDIAYYRFLLVIEAIALLAVAAMAYFGWTMAQSDEDVCQSGTTSCTNCWTFLNQTVSAGQCSPPTQNFCGATIGY